MDNLTHTLAGVLAGETAARLAPERDSALPPRVRRGLFMTLMVVGSNLPDLDFLYSTLTGSKLDYLLHHRGHTHTLVGAVAVALLMLTVVGMWLRRRGVRPTRQDAVWITGIALCAPLLHVLMDFGNNYGVHPFWPAYNGWLYGDAIFIVEPAFWAAVAPLAVLLRTAVARVIVTVLPLAGIALGLALDLMPIAHAAALLGLAAALRVFAHRARPVPALTASIVAWTAIAATFALSGRLAARQLDAELAHTLPAARTLDRALAPLPSNPFCWEAQLAQLEGEHYVVRRAMLSLLPGWMPADQCPTRALEAPTTAALEPVARPASPTLQWHGQLRMLQADLVQLVAEHCEAAAFMRFARIPWLQRTDDGWLIGDLRYDREPQLGFAELALHLPPAKCPRNVPPWIPPRQDLLQTGRLATRTGTRS